jgi:hypothetical protein
VIPDINSKVIFEKADKKINEMHMILNRLIPENDLHCTITETAPIKIFVIPDDLTVYKIPCRSKPSPCKINIKYLEKKVAGITPDLKVWISTTETTPFDQKCDQKHIAPSSILVVDE